MYGACPRRERDRLQPSASRTRRVTSSRFPIGVAQTVSGTGARLPQRGAVRSRRRVCPHCLSERGAKPIEVGDSLSTPRHVRRGGENLRSAGAAGRRTAPAARTRRRAPRADHAGSCFRAAHSRPARPRTARRRGPASGATARIWTARSLPARSNRPAAITSPPVAACSTRIAKRATSSFVSGFP